MTLISEDSNDNVNVDIQNKFNRKTEDFTDNIQDLKLYKTKETMAIKKELVEVSDDQVCRHGETEASDLTDKMMTLTLDEKPMRKSEPQEDDERPDQPSQANTDVKKEVTVTTNNCDILVNIPAPSCDDNEDSEEYEPGDPDKLKDRGPMNGVPSYHNQSTTQGCPGNLTFQMPPNFPDYGNNNLDIANQLSSNKRYMDNGLEPYNKYVKPQNDLSNPSQSSRYVMSNVNQRQMSGGTVVTSPESDILQNFSPNPQDQMTNIGPEDFFVLGQNISELLACDDTNVDGYYSQSEECTSGEPSPQGYNHSPPPTPMSQDSGVYSPMSEDSQGKSPRQTNLETYGQTYQYSHMSPQHQVGTSPPHQVRMSPPHQARMSPPHYVGMSPAQQVCMSPPHQPYQPQQHPVLMHQIHSPQNHHHHQQQVYQPPAMVPSSTVFQQQMNVNNRCNMSPQSQQVPCIADFDPDFYHPFVDEHLGELQRALYVIGNDLKNTLEKKSLQDKVNVETTLLPQCPPQQQYNIPKTVTTPVLDNERLPQPKRIVQKFQGPSNAQKKAPQLSSSPPQTVPSQQAATSSAKLPIPPLRRPQPPPSVVLNQTGVPVFLIRSQTHARYKEIRPKETSDPVKPINCSIENLDLNCTTSSSPPAAPPAAPQQPNSTPTSKVSLITIARRIVAEMPTSELIKIDSDGDMVLHVSVCRPNCLSLVQALLERLNREGLDDRINAQNYNGQTPLYLSVSSNHPKVVKLLIEKNADVNPFAECKLPSGVTEKSAAIHCASSRGEAYLETLKELLKAPDINVHQFNSDGHTPLNCAILCHGKVEANGSRINSIPIIQTLIEAGADPNLQTQKSGKTSLMYALESRDIDLIEKIFQLVDPAKLPSYLKSNAFDGSTCQKIADSLRSTLDQADQQRLINCMKPRAQRAERS